MVRITGKDWREKLTPIEEVEKIPKGIKKLMNLLCEWVKGNGKTYGKTGKDLRALLKKYPDLHKLITHLDMSGTGRVARIEVPLKKGKRAFFLKWINSGREIDTLEKLRTTTLTGDIFGYLPGPGEVPDFIIREFVPGLDHRGMDLGKIPKGNLVKIARSLGKKLRKLHEFGLGIAEDGDLIFDLKTGNIYFVDFDRVKILHKEFDKIIDILGIRQIFSTARPKIRDALWDIFLNNYGKEFAKKFSSSRLKEASNKQ